MAIKQYSLKKDGAKQLSPAFRVREFRCRDGTDTILIDEALWCCCSASGSTSESP